MNEIQIKYTFHPLSLIIYIIAYYYVVMASINDGLSSFWLGIPYALFLLWEILFLKKENNIKYLHIFILLLASFLAFSDRSQLQILYPMVGETYIVTNDINYSYGNFYINEIEVYDNQYYNYIDEQKVMFTLKVGDTFNIKNQQVTGHADFGVNYTYKIESKSFSALHNYIEKNLSKIKLKLNNEYKRDFNEEKTEFYFDEEKKFYISDYSLRELMKMQKLHYDETNFETKLTYMSFFILIYPIILILFFLVVIFKNKELNSKHLKP